MRTITGCALAGGFLLVLASAARAQSSPGEYGGFPPAGNMNASPLGPNLSASYGMYPGGLPINPNTTPNSFYGANYVLPQADSSSSSNPAYFTYGTSGQGTSYYGANYVLPVPGGQSPGNFTYGPTSGQPTTYYGANYYRALPGNQFTYTGSPAGASPLRSNNTLLPGVSSYTRLVSPSVVPRNMAGSVAPGTNQAPSTIPPGAYFTPRLR